MVRHHSLPRRIACDPGRCTGCAGGPAEVLGEVKGITLALATELFAWRVPYGAKDHPPDACLPTIDCACSREPSVYYNGFAFIGINREDHERIWILL